MGARPRRSSFQDPWHPAETLARYRPPPLRVPLAALRLAVEHDAANSIALIRHLAVEEPRVADLLIDLARAPEGPPSNPDLPANLIEVIFGFRHWSGTFWVWAGALMNWFAQASGNH